MENVNLAVDELHQKGMYLADEAFYAKREDKLQEAQAKYLAAFDMKKPLLCS